MVGYFGPLIPRILKITRKLTVLEKREIETPQTMTQPSEKAREVLPESDVIILSASTLANRTFDELLSFRVQQGKLSCSVQARLSTLPRFSREELLQ